MTQRIVIFRALMLGDLLCATPTLRAIRHAHPQAQIALVGLPAIRALVERLDSVDELIEFPGWPGLPEQPLTDPQVLPGFLAQMQARHFDWALQLHGSGPTVNPLVLSFGARHSAGFATGSSWPGLPEAQHFIQWPEHGPEVQRLLALTDHLGWARQGTQLDYPLKDLDFNEARELLRPLQGQPFVIVHPGSQLPSRRWPIERFAQVARSLAEQNLGLVLSGTPGESELTQTLAAQVQRPVLNLTGQTSLWTLGALIQLARGVVCNDTSLSHIASAVGTPSVVISNGGDALRWSPPNTERHQVLWRDLPCRPCAHTHCPHDQACARAVPVDAVRHAAQRLFGLTSFKTA